jgi:hypothetical protein
MKMSKNVTVNGKVYSGVSQIQLNTTDGVTALFQDMDEISATGGGVETGTLVGTGENFASINVTSDTPGLAIPVSSVKTHIAIELEEYSEEISAGMADHAVISSLYQVKNGYCIATGVRHHSTPSSGYYGGATIEVDNGKKVLFSENKIYIKAGISVQQEALAEGKTYRWYAW